MTAKSLAVLALLGYAVAASVKPETYLPPTTEGRVVLITAALLSAIWPVLVAYRLRTLLEETQEKIAAVPEKDRELIFHLRRVAGKAIHPYTGAPIAGSPSDASQDQIQELRNACAELHHYEGIYSAGIRLIRNLCFMPMVMVHPAEEFPKRVDKLEEDYRSLLVECGRVVKPTVDPPPSKAS